MDAHVDVGRLTPKEYRQMVRKGEWTGSSMEACKGWALSDMIIVPREYAFDLFLFAQRNPQILPLIEVTDPGSPVPSNIASDTDIRTDLPRYQVFKNGELAAEPTDILDYWQDDLVTFFTGCSIAFDRAFELARVNFRGVGAFSTNIPCIPAGPFHGDMVVSVRIFASASDGLVTLGVPLRAPPLLRKVFGRYTGETSERDIELDEIGSVVWEMCDGKTTIRNMIQHLSERYKPITPQPRWHTQ